MERSLGSLWWFNTSYEQLVEEAKKVLKNSYAPYSGIHVSSAVLTNSGRIYLGVNVENSSYGLTICAERSALTAMVTAGERSPVAVAIITDLDEPIPPCGACRQFIAEFNSEAVIIMHSVKSGKRVISKLSDIYPNPFRIKS